MNESDELDYIRDLNDVMKVQVETLLESLEKERVEVARLTALVTRLEELIDAKNAEIIRLTVSTPY